MPRAWSKRSAVHRILKPSPSPQQGEDVKALQQGINQRARARGMRTVDVDGVFGPDTMKAALAVGWRLGALNSTLRKGHVTRGLQRIIRNPSLRTPAQLVRSKQRKPAPSGRVSYPIDPARLITDAWGYHPGVHDGVDLICPANEPLLAMCKARVVRVSASGWWGLGAPSDPGVAAKGDGIIILQALENTGPIKEGLNLCYGHAEHATVTVGQTVNAGHVIGRAGLANAWHVHFCVNDNPPVNGFYKGVGDRDPRPILNYAKKETA